MTTVILVASVYFLRAERLVGTRGTAAQDSLRRGGTSTATVTTGAAAIYSWSTQEHPNEYRDTVLRGRSDAFLIKDPFTK
jgi:hypothetical protein